ncbi:MAG: hypothetical protein EP297_15795 [Gammaproteobacteria bacterium]|nr:MAG: hypothetical protein EP297_15795 [Gammaproteobacteria bacterium]
MKQSDNIERFLTYTAMYLRQTEKDPREINYQEIQKILQQLDISSLRAGQDQRSENKPSIGQTLQILVSPSRH